MSGAAAGGVSNPGPAAVLVGFMGAGKSTIGRILAERLSVAFIDTDGEIQARTGRSIPEIFATERESGFRSIECDVVLDVLGTSEGVVALGGGSVLTPRVRDALRGQPVVYLRISAERGFARVAASDRPLLAADDPAGTYRALLESRLPTYESVATITVDVHKSPTHVVDEVIEALRSRARTDPSATGTGAGQ